MKSIRKKIPWAGPLGLAIFLLNTGVQAADIAQGKAKAATCAGCHGIDGIALSQEYPNLAGQNQAYLVKQLTAFRDGSRSDPTMNAMAKALTDSDIDNLAGYYASLGTAKGTSVTQRNAAKTSRAGQAEFPETIFITMKKSGSVETYPQEKVWAGGPNMLYNAVTPDGKRLVATSPSSGSVYIFDTNNGKQLSVVSVGKAPKGVKISPDGREAYISNEGSAEISVIDLNSLKNVDTIKVEKAPHNVRFTRKGDIAYVTLQGGAGIGVIDTAKRKMVRVIPVPGITGPHNVDLSRDEKTAYVRDFVHHVAVLDLSSGKVRKVIKVGNGHGGIDVAPDGSYVATAAIGDDIISVINPKDLSVKNIKVGNAPHGIRASKDSKWIYVTLTKDNTIAVVNAKTLVVEKKIAAQQFPFWIAVNGNP